MYLLANVNTRQVPYSAVWGYKAPDGREYGIIGTNDGTQFVDITDVSNIHEVGFIPSTSPGNYYNLWREMKVYSHYAYIVSEVSGSGFQIVDLQYLPDSVHYVKKFLPSGYSSTHSISQLGPYLYANGASIGQGVTIFDLTVDPENPVMRGSFNNEYIHDCRVVNDTIYAANIYSGRVSIINAVNKNSLNLVTSFQNLPGAGPHNTAVTEDRKNLLVTDEIGSVPHLLKIWNIEDLNNITYLASWQPTNITTAIVHNVETYGKYALVAHYEAGVRLVDISNPSLPTEVAWYDTYPSTNNTDYEGCWGVYMFPTGKIVASDRNTGLYVLKTNFNISVAIQGFYNSSSNTLNKRDTINAYLRNANPPYAVVDSSKSVIDSVTLTGNFRFNKALSGTYYIALKHRNSIETWSRINGEVYNPMNMNSYDFTNSVSKAYSSNMIQVDNSPVKFAIYNGDVNQDETIDASDISIVDNDVTNSVSGYTVSDLTGDNNVDASDLSLVDNNAVKSISSVKP
jgi:choice-of-anchor B domain-containing protein